MGVKFNDLAYTSLEEIINFNPRTGEHWFTLDELQNATIGNTEDSQDITGKGGRLLASIKRNKAVTVSGASGLVSGGMIEAQTGSEFKAGNVPLRVPDFMTVENDKATTTYKATGTAGNEIPYIYVTDDDGIATRKLTQGATAAAGIYEYDPATKEITFFAGDVADGTRIAAYYDRTVEGSILSNVSDKFSQTTDMYVNVFAEDKCNKLYFVQYHIPAADFVGNFDLALGDSQTVHNFEARSRATACGTGVSKFYDVVIVGQDVADA